MTRRNVMGMIAAGSAMACSKAEATGEASSEPSVAIDSSVNAVLKTIALPRQGPWPTPDPFLFCMHHADHYPRGNENLGPSASLAGRDLGMDFGGKDGWSMYHGTVVPGFPQHPHRGFETVTVVRRGLLDHADSMGATARYGQGDVQWLTAGAGIQHAEMFPLLESERDNPLELFQLWLNLPKANKMVTPHFSMLWANTIPKRTFRDQAGRVTEVTLNAGALQGVVAPSPPPGSWAHDPANQVAIWTIKMAPMATWIMPAASAGMNRSLYGFAGGSFKLNQRTVEPRSRVDLRAEVAVKIENGSQEGEFLLLQGRPINEPVAQQGPFVMNTPQEIRAAFYDYQRTQFGGWPWSSSGPVHARDAGRFARRPDGSIERPA